MAEYDLTQVRLTFPPSAWGAAMGSRWRTSLQKLIPHLDRHLAIPLLNHLSDIAIFPAEQLAKAQYDLVKGTNMVDYVEQLYEQAKADGASLEPRGGSGVESV
jgi:hypothetical protein